MASIKPKKRKPTPEEEAADSEDEGYSDEEYSPYYKDFLSLFKDFARHPKADEWLHVLADIRKHEPSDILDCIKCPETKQYRLDKATEEIPPCPFQRETPIVCHPKFGETFYHKHISVITDTTNECPKSRELRSLCIHTTKKMGDYAFSTVSKGIKDQDTESYTWFVPVKSWLKVEKVDGSDNVICDDITYSCWDHYQYCYQSDSYHVLRIHELYQP